MRCFFLLTSHCSRYMTTSPVLDKVSTTESASDSFTAIYLAIYGSTVETQQCQFDCGTATTHALRDNCSPTPDRESIVAHVLCNELPGDGRHTRAQIMMIAFGYRICTVYGLLPTAILGPGQLMASQSWCLDAALFNLSSRTCFCPH